jgi:hypothetical protein
LGWGSHTGPHPNVSCVSVVVVMVMCKYHFSCRESSGNFQALLQVLIVRSMHNRIGTSLFVKHVFVHRVNKDETNHDFVP